MRKIFLVFCVIASTLLVGCSKDSFDYPMEYIYGTWNGTEVHTDSGWINITSSYYERFHFSISFFSDGSYKGSGAFGNGTGTYTAKGSTITTFVDGKEFYKYDVISCDGENAELRMYHEGETMAETSEIFIRVEKE